MKKIVVAIDFSDEAQNAMQYVSEAAAELALELVFFTLYNPSIHLQNARASVASFDSLLNKQTKKLNDLAAATIKVFGIPVTVHLASGDFHRELQHCVLVHQADMVVMGMAKKSLEQELLGNTTTSTIGRMTTPVLAIPASAKYRGIKHILFACDVLRGVHVKVLERVKDVSKKFGATVEIFSVNNYIGSGSSLELPGFDGCLSDIKYYYKNVESKEIVKAIRQEVEDSAADLLIMVPYKYGFWGSIVHRSATRIMASGSNVPLLSIPLV